MHALVRGCGSWWWQADKGDNYIYRFTRLHYLGVRRDDFMMIFAMGTYTTLLVSMNLIVVGGGSNLFPPEKLHTFTPMQVQDRIKGSKIVLVSEQAMVLTIWSLKACMLTFYHCLTFVPRPPSVGAS